MRRLATTTSVLPTAALWSLAPQAGATAVDCDADPTSIVPQGVHLAYAGDPATGIAVSYFTCGAGGAPDATIEGGENATGTTSKYYKRHHHDVVITGLQPGTAYSYTVGLGGGGPRSSQFVFRTAPQAPADGLWTALVVGDMGVNNSAATMARMIQRAPATNFTIHLGDMSYADDFNMPLHIEPSSGRSYEAVYDLFQQQMEPLTAAQPYMVAVGNHEICCSATDDWSCPDEQKNFSAYRHRFRMPSIESGAAAGTPGAINAHHNMWYSWRVGSVHFVAFDTETDFPNAPTIPDAVQPFNMHGGGFGNQLAWLRQDLAAADADPTVKWIVGFAHRPWYASDGSDWPPLTHQHAQKAFEPLMHEYEVDLLLFGHKHYYERAAAALDGKADPVNGIPQVINGAGGSSEGIDNGKGIGGLTVAANYVHWGYGELAVVNSTALRWQYVLANDGSVDDELIIPQRRHL